MCCFRVEKYCAGEGNSAMVRLADLLNRSVLNYIPSGGSCKIHASWLTPVITLSSVYQCCSLVCWSGYIVCDGALPQPLLLQRCQYCNLCSKLLDIRKPTTFFKWLYCVYLRITTDLVFTEVSHCALHGLAVVNNDLWCSLSDGKWTMLGR